MDSIPIYSSITPASNFAPSSPPVHPIDKAVERYHRQQQRIAYPIIKTDTTNAYQNLDIILARLNRIEQMIDGASISATCSGTTTVITLTWGS